MCCGNRKPYAGILAILSDLFVCCTVLIRTDGVLENRYMLDSSPTLEWYQETICVESKNFIIFTPWSPLLVKLGS